MYISSVMAKASCSKSSNFTSTRFPSGIRCLLFFIFIEQTAVYFDKIAFDLLVGDVLQAEWLDRIGKEAARALEHRIRISFQIDKFSIREHFHQGLHTSRMRRILAQELTSFRIPEGNLDQLRNVSLNIPAHVPLILSKADNGRNIRAYASGRTRNYNTCKASYLPRQIPLPGEDPPSTPYYRSDACQASRTPCSS